MEFTIDEAYGVIGAVIAAIIAGLVRYRDKIFNNDKEDVQTSIKDKFDTQNKILDKGLENIIDSVERLEEKVDYMHVNSEEKMKNLRADVDKVDTKTEKISDKLGDIINKFFAHVESHSSQRR